MGSLTYHPLNIYLKIMVGGSSRENCLHVRGCHRDTRDSDVHSMFGKYGTIIDTHIPSDYYTREPRGFFYVQFDNYDDAERAKDDCHGKELLGRRLTIEWARGSRRTPEEMAALDSRSRRYRGGTRHSRSFSEQHVNRNKRSHRRRGTRSVSASYNSVTNHYSSFSRSPKRLKQKSHSRSSYRTN